MRGDDLATAPVLEKLLGGAEIIERKSIPKREGELYGEVILCRLPHNRATPYVVWKSTHDRRNPPEVRGCHLGQYFQAHQAYEAVIAFAERS